jgi:hypothetical protein
MRVYVLLAACLLSGCTRANADFQGNGGGSGGTGGGGGVPGAGGGGGVGGGGIGGNGSDDLGTVGSSDMTTLSGGDMAHGPAVCSGDARRCVTTPVESQACSPAGQWEPDRDCPYGTTKKTGAACMSGYCEPPPPAIGGHLDGCVGQPGNGQPQETLCMQDGKDFSCQPFINAVTKMPSWWCAVAVNAGSGTAGDSCSTGSDCHAGFCGSNGTCFYGCQTDDDCQQANGKSMLACKQVTIHVEGQTLATSSCAP